MQAVITMLSQRIYHFETVTTILKKREVLEAFELGIFNCNESFLSAVTTLFWLDVYFIPVLIYEYFQCAVDVLEL